ncbi:MAG: aldehyde ferredoxin oxidoreductase family protein [Dehalococcoidales bacterium]|nr:MAG: aldehyde ferredoxin oxidoreductase family protein [Dehalococcoidales bacterium]
MESFHGKVLCVDVGQRSVQEERIDDTVFLEFLGGKGLGSRLLVKNTLAGFEPYSQDSVIVFATGPVTGTRVLGSSRYGVFCKSPLTGVYCESYAGGSVAEPLSRTGYDAVVIKGISSSPVYLEISSGGVEFHDASHLWGKETYETEDIVRKEVSRKDVGIVVIGPAGENLVRFAVIENDYWRSAGRTGAGAVLGSKKIKALVFHGEKQRKVAKPSVLKRVWKETGQKTKTDPAIMNYRRLGTPMLVATTNENGAFPTKYWSRGTFESWRNISAPALLEQCRVKPKACPKCPLACGNLTEVIDGRHRGLRIEGPEYETIYAFGGLCLIDNIREIAYLNDLCDRLGIDTITAGNLAAFAIEASHRKVINERIDYGDVDGIAELLHRIVHRRGIGAILAEGIIHASREWGLEDLAIHVKGLEPGGYDPRVLKGMGLAYATSDRGACHLRATVYKAELSGMIAPDQIEGKAEVLIDFEDRHTLFDSLILCRFFRDLYPWELLSLIIEGTTGRQLDKSQLSRIAANITSEVRQFNLREGMSAADDTLPKRFFEEPLEDSGKILPKSEFDRMLSDYYRLREWAQAG